ncbi:MAG TPA: IclR family transcriptional regulator [Chloroflexota bacterium]|nr:IclR family transcriptional regulator [Chloroflexota bacterium]
MTFGSGKSSPPAPPERPEIRASHADDAPGARENARDRAVKSVEHALDILDLLARRKTAAGVTQLAEELGMNVSTAHHLLRTLQSRRLVEQDPDSKLYRLGVRSVQLGQAYLASLDIYAVTHPFLREAALQCGETVTLAALDGTSIVTLATIPGRFTVRSLGATTNRHNAHATALGKILLAGLPPSELHDMVAESGLTRFTPHTIGTFRQLEADLEQVRDRGFALDLQELEVGLGCAAVGIPNHRGEMVAAIGVSVPVARFDDGRRTDLINLLRKAAQQIATRLGYEERKVI